MPSARPKSIRDFEKIRNHYGVNRMALVAGEAALADQAYLARGVRKVAAGRERIAKIARDNGLSPIPSATNFVTIDCGGDGAFALKVMEELLAARRLHPQADGAGAQPLHPRQRRPRPRARHLRRGIAEGAGGGAAWLSFASKS